MPLCLCRPRAAIRRAVLPPLRLATAPYQTWRQRRVEMRAADAERYRIAAEKDAELAAQHDRLWEHLPEAVEWVRTHARTIDRRSDR